MLSKNVNNKKCAPKLIFFNEKKIEKDLDNFWHRKLTLKVRNWDFSIARFRADVDLTKIFLYEEVLFFTQLTSHLMRKLLKKSCMLSKLYNCRTYFILDLNSKSSYAAHWDSRLLICPNYGWMWAWRWCQKASKVF